MAEYIKTLKEDNGDITYPVTQAGAVLLSGGGDLETTLNGKASQASVNGKISVGDVQPTDIVANAVTTVKIADEAITEPKIDWSTFGPIWSTFYFTKDDVGDHTVVTRKGTQLTICVGNQGTGVWVVSGGDNINCIRQYWGAQYNASNTGNWGVNALASGSKVYTTFYGARNNGSNINIGQNTSTANTGIDGDCYADLASLTGGKTSAAVDLTVMRVRTDRHVWQIKGNVSAAGTSTNMQFSAECTSAAGHIPTIYQRYANVAWSWNCIEILEA